ncbi:MULTISPECIES: acyl carrier protein [Bacillus cereus group]|uniref:acyl carrier protein n=1 Tax=Bacillus cereus group TaxID=86661 RepID=UPI001F5A3F89|nr:acyl carrier protein [Bacillus pacificus]MED0823864.1 acyl carrier protein [Bacillus pacificus]
MRFENKELLKKYLKSVICSVLEREINISENTKLTSHGLDSLMIVSLVVALEGDLGIAFNDEHLMLDIFDNVESLSNLLLENYGVIEG